MSLPYHPPEKHPVAHSVGGQAIQTIQGLYYVIVGLWVAFLIQSLQSETGSRYDLSHLWVVRFVGFLVAAFGAALVASGRKKEGPFIGAGAALCVAIALGVLGAVCLLTGVLPPLFLVDVGGEIGFAGWWAAAILFWFNSGTTGPAPLSSSPFTPGANG